jgi:hypothetical protein
VEVVGVLKSGFVMMGKVSIEIDLTNIPNSRGINESLEILKGQPVLVKVEGANQFQAVREDQA